LSIGRATIVFEKGTNHKRRVTEKIGEMLPPREKVSITFFEVVLAGGAVVSWVKEEVEIESLHVCNDFEYSVLSRNFGLEDSLGKRHLALWTGCPFKIYLQRIVGMTEWTTFIYTPNWSTGTGVGTGTSDIYLAEQAAKQVLLDNREYMSWWIALPEVDKL